MHELLQAEELSNTAFVLAFDDHRLRVDSWDVHYRITAEPGGAGSNVQADWEAVMGSNPYQFDESGSNCPVESDAWDAVESFSRRLSAVGGEERCRLPTEAEWEYAARAETRRRPLRRGS